MSEKATCSYCDWTGGHHPNCTPSLRLENGDVTWQEAAPLTPEREEEIVSKIEAVEPEACSHCGDALCQFDEPGHADDASHHGAKSFFTGEIITSPANAACTRTGLVTVKDCRPLRENGCPWWHRAKGGLVYCDLADLHIFPSLKFGLPTNQLKGGKACPLMEEGKPGPGVKIVAIKEDRG